MRWVPLAGPQQVRHRGIRAVFHEVADPVAAVEQAATLPVDEGESGLAGDDAFEAGGEGSGWTGSWPARSRAKAASADGAKAVKARACSTVGGQGRSWVAPQADTAVRSASIGLVELGRARRTARTSVGTWAVGSRWLGSQPSVHSRFATAGYVPCSTRSPIR